MFNYKLEFRENGEWLELEQVDENGKVRKPWERPIVDKEALDDTLDHGTLTLWNIDRKEKLLPLTHIRLTIFEREGESDDWQTVDIVYMLVGSSNIKQTRFSYG